MGSFDSLTWQALTLVLTVLGGVLSVLVWRSRGAISGLRAVAATLLVPAAYLTGTLRLLWDVADAVVSWGVRLAFSPTVWLGVALASVSATLFAGSSLAARRRGTAGARPRLRSGRAGEAAAPTALEPRRAEGKRAGPKDEPGHGGGEPAPGDDMEDIEAILRRHGIS